VRPVARLVALVAVVGVLALAGLAGTGRHTIKRGETLSSIARKYGIPVAVLQFANGIPNPNLIVAGSTLAIPDGSDAPASGGSSTTSYVVRAGDTLAGIAKRFGTTTAKIQFANGIKNPNVVVIGKTLTIPVAAASGGGGDIPVEKVRPGDTLTKIAARTGVPASVIAAANGLHKPYTLYTGTMLLLAVRNGADAPPLAQCPAPGTRFMNDWGFPRSDTGSHQGTDLMGKRGTQLLAAASGTASQIVGRIGGNQVKLTADDGTVYWYAHLDTFGKSGRVKAGSVLGGMGDSGDAKGGPVHLHFEVHPAGGAAVNPYPLLRAACG
jgi:murein DD-endopeptidase MepM/ murein hydrolase activator NlpD